MNGDAGFRGGAEEVKELHRRGEGWGGGGVPEERQNTGPEPQLVIW